MINASGTVGHRVIPDKQHFDKEDFDKEHFDKEDPPGPKAAPELGPIGI